MLAKITNKNSYPYKEKFKGKNIEIPPGGSIEMEYYEGVEFMGTMCPVERDAGGTPKPTSYKQLVIERIGPVDQPRWVCQYDGQEFPTKEQLHAHMERNGFAKFAHDPKASASNSSADIETLKAENEQLKDRLASIEEMLAEKDEKRGRGRPRKDA